MRFSLKPPMLKNVFLLTYSVDGHKHPLSIDSKAKGAWYGLSDTEGAYEFTVDQLYSTRRARDFISIRVRGTPVLLAARP